MKRIIRAELVRSAHRAPDGVHTVFLEESGADARLKRVSVRGVPADGYVIDLDASTCVHRGAAHRFPQFSSHFDRAGVAINKICDAALIMEEANRIRVSLVDLKSTAPNLVETNKQLTNSRYFMSYVWSLLNWRDGEQRPPDFSMHVIMINGAKARVGGARTQPDVRNYVRVHGLTVDRVGHASVRWGDFFT
ncbi:hypothetical protein Llan_2617 [Legionella lansingensis]|uniref:Uncharacterized protein n=1 Tax=Legionella lansingensis TaxID=45067 RepID=A0A0W0V729_9GAMM|nr:hypothetical protein Llan_2617 [Legionella lansingensis]